MEPRRCILARGATSPVARAWLARALGEGGQEIDPAKPTPAGGSAGAAEVVGGFCHTQDYWVPAAPGREAGWFRVVTVALPDGESGQGAAGFAGVDVVVLAVGPDPAERERFGRLLQMVRALGVRNGLVVRLAAPEATATGTVHPAADAADFPAWPVFEAQLEPAEEAERLRPRLAELLLTLPPPAAEPGRPRVWLAGSLDPARPPARVRGLLTEGPLRCDQTLALQPGGLRARLRELHTPQGPVTAVDPPQEVELVLEWEAAGARPATTRPAAAGARPPSSPAPADEAATSPAPGHVLADPAPGAAADTLDVCLVPAAEGPRAADDVPFPDREPVRVWWGPRVVAGVVFRHPAGAAGAPVLAQLRLSGPVLALGGDRLVVEAASAPDRVGTARVLDPAGDRKRWQRHEQRALLAARAAAFDDPAVWLVSQVRRDRWVAREGLLARTRFRPAAVAAALRAQLDAGQVVAAGGWITTAEAWQRRVQRAAEAVERWHESHPERAGLPWEALEALLAEDPLPAEARAAWLHALRRAGYALRGNVVQRRGYVPTVPERLREAVAWVRQELTRAPLEPPGRAKLTPDADTARALVYLLESGQAIAVGPTVVLESGVYSRLVELVRQHLRRYRQARLSEVRQWLGTTQRILEPLCEHWQSRGLLRREGAYLKLAAGPRPAGSAQRRTRRPRREPRPPGRHLPPGAV